MLVLDETGGFVANLQLGIEPSKVRMCKHADPVRNLPTRPFDADSRPRLPQSVGIRLRSISTGSGTKRRFGRFALAWSAPRAGWSARMCARIGGLEGLSTFSAIEKIATISANCGPV
jgi:hypothetical protein